MSTSVQLFTTTGANTFTWPTGVTSVLVEAIGAGGGGGIASGNPATGGGGKGGSYSKATVTKGAETTLAITVGAGGAIATAGAASSVVQSSTTVCLAPGGGGGATQASSSANGAGGTTLNGTAVGTTFAGGNGGTGNFTSGTQGSGAGGGAGGPTGAGAAGNVNVAGIAGTGTFANGVAYSGAGAAGVGNSTVGINGPTYGGGASGGKASSGADQNGGVGAQGMVLVSWTDPATTLSLLNTSAKARQANLSTALAVPMSTAPAVGSGLVLTVLGTWSFPTPTSPMVFGANWVTDNKGNTYKLAVTKQLTGATNFACAIYYCEKVVTAGSSFTISITPDDGANHYFVASAREIGGLSGTNILKLMQTASNTGATATTAASGSTATVTGEALAVAVMERGLVGVATAITAEFLTPNWTEQVEELDGSGFISGEGDLRITSYSGAVSANWTHTATSPWCAAIAAFQSAAPPADQAVTGNTIASGSVVRVPTVTQNVSGARIASTAILRVPTVMLTYMIGGAFIEPTISNYTWWTQFPTGGYLSATFMYGPNEWAEKVGQQFAVPEAKVLTAIDVVCDRDGSPTDNLTMELLSGGVQGTLLATFTPVACSSVGLSDNGGLVTFTLPTPVALVPGTLYAFVLKRTTVTTDYLGYINLWTTYWDSTVVNDAQLNRGYMDPDPTHGLWVLDTRTTPVWSDERAVPPWFSVEYRLKFAPRIYAPTVALVSAPSAQTIVGATIGGTSAITLVSHTFGQDWRNGSGTTAAINTAGATLLASILAWYRNSTDYVPTDSKSNSWPLAISNDYFNLHHLDLRYATGPPNVGSGHTLSFSTDDSSFVGFNAFAGVHPTTPLDQTSTAGSWTGGVTPPLRPGSITPPVAGCLFLTAVVYAYNQENVYTIDSGFTILDQVIGLPPSPNFVGAIAYKIQTGAAAAENPGWNTVSGDGAVMITLMACFKPATGGGGAGVAQTFAPAVAISGVSDQTILGATCSGAVALFAPTVVGSQTILGATISPKVTRFSDAFPWSDGNLVTVSGGLWAQGSYPTNGFDVISHKAHQQAPGECGLYVPGFAGSLTAQWAEVTIDFYNDDIGLLLYNNGAGQYIQCPFYSNLFQINYRTGGNYYGLESMSHAGLVPGDVFRVEVVPTGTSLTITAYLNGVFLLSHTGTELNALGVTSGKPGMYSSAGGAPLNSFSAFAAGDFGAQAFAPTVSNAVASDQTIIGATIGGTFSLLLEDTTKLVLEDASGNLLLETASVGTSQTFAPSISTAAPDQAITGATRPSTVALSSPAINVGAVTVVGATLVSTVQLSAPSLAPGPVTIVGSTRPSTAQIYAPSVAAGPVTLIGSTVSSSVQVYAPSVAAGPVTLLGATRASTALLSPPSVLPQAVTVVGATCASTLQVFAPSIATGPVSVTGATLASSAQLFPASIAVGPVTILGATRASQQSMFAATLAYVVVGAFIGSTASATPPSVIQTVVGATRPTTLQVFAPSVAPGAVTVLGATIASTSGVFAPAVSPGPVTIVGATRSSTVLLFAPSVAPGPVTISVAFITSTAQLFLPSVTSVAPGSIGATTISTTVQLYPPSVSLAMFVVTGATITSTATLFPPSAVYVLVGATIGSTVVLRAPSVQPGPVTITGATIAFSSSLYPPSLGAGATTIVGAAIGSVVVCYPLTVQPGPVTIVGATISSTVQLSAPSVTTVAFVTGATRPTTALLFPSSMAYVITGATISAGSVCRAPSVTVGPVTVIGGTITSTVQLHAPLVTTLTFVTAGTIGSISQVFAPSVVAGGITIGGATILSGTELFGPIVTPGPVSITGATCGSAVQCFPPSLLVEERVIGGTVLSTVLMYAPSVIRRDLTTGWIDSTDLLYPPLVTTDAVEVSVGGIGPDSQVYPPAILKVLPPGTCLVSALTVQYLVTHTDMSCMMMATGRVTVRYLGTGIAVSPVVNVTSTVQVRTLVQSDGVHVCCLEMHP